MVMYLYISCIKHRNQVENVLEHSIHRNERVCVKTANLIENLNGHSTLLGRTELMLITYKLYYKQYDCEEKTFGEEQCGYHAIIGEFDCEKNSTKYFLPYHYKGLAKPINFEQNKFVIGGAIYEYGYNSGILSKPIGDIFDDGYDAEMR